MYFGFYTGLGLNMGMPYFGGMSGFGCYSPFYNPFSMYQYNPWYTLNNFIQPNFSWNYSPFCFNTYNPIMPSVSLPSMTQSFSYSPMTIDIGFSASDMLKSGTQTQSSSVTASNTSSQASNEAKSTPAVSSPFNGYNEAAGKRLAEIALKNSDSFHNQCSAHVNNAISEANLGDNTNLDANQMFGQMRSNPNFKEISASTDTSSLKAGTVLIYDKGVSGYGDWGHIEIALGDGRAVSDGITEKIKPNPSAIFIPTSA